MESVTETVADSQPDELQPNPIHLNRAVGSRTAHLRFWLVVVFGLLVDLWTKHWAQTTLEGHAPQSVITDLLSLQYSTNRGALFGIGENLPMLFIAASICALFFVLYVFVRSNAQQRSFHVALGMILAGALGNLHDRLFVGGQVRDFIKIELSIGDREIWPWIFNIADALLVCGVAILMLNIWRDRKHVRKPDREQSPTPS